MSLFKSNYYRDNHSNNLEFLLSLIIIAACLILAAIFPVQAGVQEITKDLFFLVFIPVLYIRLILKKSLADFGINLKNRKMGFIGAAVMFVLAALTSLCFLRYNEFRMSYYLPDLAVSHFGYFILYEFLFINFYLIIYEFFFRGFVLFVLAPVIKFWAVPAQLLILLAPSVLTGKLAWNILPTVIIAFFGGILAYRSRSIFYSYLAAFFFNLMLDAYLIHTLK